MEKDMESAHIEIERDMESAHIEIERDMESAQIEIERDMEERVKYRMLLEAAIQGKNMEELPRLLQDDPAILDRVRWECTGKDNPLHVGALYGNVVFVREILNRKRELTCELNSEGQSPLHLASARGHVEVVKEILSQDADHDACFIRDQDGMTPLHLAAINGRVEVLEELVNAEKITAFILTKSGEPTLHLCANNNKFEALKKLIELVKDDPDFVNLRDRDDFVNLRDRDDNTILHLLAAKGKLEVMKFLLKNPGVYVNATNMDGVTPLEVFLLQNDSIWQRHRIKRLLTEKGAKRDGNNSLFMDLIKKIKISGSDESRFGEDLMVVAILMATVAFQARLCPPGGVWPDTTFNNATLPNVTHSSPPPNLVPHYAGKSVMSYVDPSSYKRFSDQNDFTFILSLLVIQLLLASYLFKSRTLKLLAVIITSLSLVTMAESYSSSATYISLDKQHLLTPVKISSLMLYICSGVWILLLELRLIPILEKVAASRAPPLQ